MKKKRIILSVGMALIALSNVNSYGAPVYGDSLSILGTNGDNIAQVYAMPDVTNSYLTQSAVTTDGNVTYNNSSLIQQLTTQGSAFFQSRAQSYDVSSDTTSGSEINQTWNSTETNTSILSTWYGSSGQQTSSNLYQQNNDSLSIMNSSSSFNDGNAIQNSTYINQSSNSDVARIYMTTINNGTQNYLQIDSSGTAVGGNLNVYGTTSTNSLDASGNISAGGSLSVSGSTTTNGISNTGSISTTTLATTGNASVGGNLSVTGNTTIDGNLTIGGTTTFTGTPTYANGLTVSGGVASFQGGASVSGGNLNMNSNRITNVAAGVSGTDAVNLNQLNAVSDQINDVSRKAYAGTASVAAIAGIPALQSDKTFNVGLGYGNYRGEDAIAIGGNARLTDAVTLKAAFGSSRNEVTSSIGVGIAF